MAIVGIKGMSLKEKNHKGTGYQMFAPVTLQIFSNMSGFIAVDITMSAEVSHITETYRASSQLV